MAPKSNSAHPTVTLPYHTRASLPSTSPLAAYLLRLIAIKRSNLCLSADVNTTAKLLDIAEECGDAICMLKTHADIIIDFSDRTVAGLREIAQRKKFLIFEDRKFCDIGSTVQKQYISGPLQIVRWAAITNATIFPGPAVITALNSAAQSALVSLNSAVSTEILAQHIPRQGISEGSSSPQPNCDGFDASTTTTNDLRSDNTDYFRQPRKASVVSVSTTITTHSESISPPLALSDADFFPLSTSSRPPTSSAIAASLDKLGDPPHDRALLLLAEMSSEGNLLTGSYTAQCVQLARQHRDFVIGFVAQRGLNSEKGDNFVTCTPGVSLPPEGQREQRRPMGDSQRVRGDALGQQYRTPRAVVLGEGCDVIIVGRGIVNADDRAREAERYRREGWRAYEERVGKGK